ncbi:Hachiman antiphage defense system protein HamA [Micromonospora sp. NPDC051925]|uniref:Hachiman antiphage defense system protein HamA n=1 Tax=Micromonospora sp. NPDC051925 TaxID=3364288 RepID=UPI0037CBE22A
MDAANFRSWCTVGTPIPTGDHRAGLIQSYDDSAGVAALAAALPAVYAPSRALAAIAQRQQKDALAKYLRNRLPTEKPARSGDMGEILATAYLHEEARYVVGPSRLIHRDHQEWAMRGDDALGAKLHTDGKPVIVKAEAKSRTKLGKPTVAEAREGLSRNEEMPSPHSLTQFADRLRGTADDDLGNAIIDLLLDDGVRPDRVSHLMFLFTSGDPSTQVAADLQAYSGPVPQLTITLRVQHHQEFIRDAYEMVIADGS